MSDRRFINPSFPSPLQLAVWFSYINGAFALLGSLGGGGSLYRLPSLAGAIGAYVMVNGKKWGYWMCVAVATLGLVSSALGIFYFGMAFALNALFSVALFAGLVHPMSRRYIKIWLD